MSMREWFKKLFGGSAGGYYCPSCGATGKVQADCTECQLPMLRMVKSNVRQEYVKMVPVFAPSGMAQLAVVKSILEEAGIPYYVRNEISQNLFGAGMIGSGFNAATGGMVVEVAEERAEEANMLLQDL